MRLAHMYRANSDSQAARRCLHDDEFLNLLHQFFLDLQAGGEEGLGRAAIRGVIGVCDGELGQAAVVDRRTKTAKVAIGVNRRALRQEETDAAGGVELARALRLAGGGQFLDVAFVRRQEDLKGRPVQDLLREGARRTEDQTDRLAGLLCEQARDLGESSVQVRGGGDGRRRRALGSLKRGAPRRGFVARANDGLRRQLPMWKRYLGNTQHNSALGVQLDIDKPHGTRTL